MFICQLSKAEKFRYYKAIKTYLINEDCYNHENFNNAWNSKIKDIKDYITL